MTDEELLGVLTPIFRDVFGNPLLVIGPGSSADNMEDWTSISHVILMVEIESALGVHFRAAEMERLRNVRDLIDAARTKMQGRAA